jgi:predicted amidohydrolase YtcJ
MASGATPDLILTNGNVVTMNPSQPQAQAVAIGRGRILAVGSNQEAESWAGPATPRRDLGGQMLLPGLYDSHNHMLMHGTNLMHVDLSSTRTLADVLAAIEARARVTPEGEWVQAASRWHETQLAEGRLPTKDELDRVSHGHPVLVRRGGHNVVANSKALELAGIHHDTPNPPEGVYVRDETGELTGQAIEVWAFRPIVEAVPKATIDDRLEALRRVCKVYREGGITSVIEPGLFPPDMAAYRESAARLELTTRANLMWRFEPGTTQAALDSCLELLQSGVVSIDRSDPWVRTQMIKLSGDGGVEAAYYRQPLTFTDDPKHPNGKIRISLENMAAFCLEAARIGWQLGVHCVGDATVLSAYEQVNESIPLAERRWALIHMMAAQPDHFERVNRLKLAITSQQTLVYSLAAGFLKYIGPERLRNLEPLRMYLENCQQPVGNGTDAPTAAYHPMVNIWSAVTRDTELAGVWGPEWAITAEQALIMYTHNSAWCAFEETVKGTIEPGKWADLVALSADPRAVEPAAIRDIQATLTMVDGQILFDRAQGHTPLREPVP